VIGGAMIRFLKNYGIFILAGLLAVALTVVWFLYPSIRRASCGFALAAVIIIGLIGAIRFQRSIYRD
jgi:uncharacterized membrane protein YvlD (DUF360 family)